MAESKLTDLIARLEAATEGCRDLDLVFAQTVGANWSYTGEPPRVIYCKPFTTSLDAIVALIERKLPDRAWMLSSPDKLLSHPLCQGEIAEGELAFETVKGCAPTPALALCIALLSALRQQGGSEHE